MKLPFDLRNCYPSPEPALVAHLESVIQDKLPEDYRQFLESYNGGGCPDDLIYPAIGRPDAPTLGFLGFMPLVPDKSKALLRVAQYMRSNETEIDYLLPIAEAPDAYLCISFQPEEHGAFYWWANDGDEHYDPDALILVNHSFQEWLESVRPVPPEIVNSDQPFIAVEKGDMEFLVQWINEGGDPNITNANGESLLHYAVRRPRILTYLLSLGGDLDVADNKGETPLIRASWGQLDSVRLLLSHGANPWKTDHRGENAIDHGKHFQRIREFFAEYLEREK